MKEWRVYKPKKTNDGAASKLECRVEPREKETSTGGVFIQNKMLVFWVATKQTGTDANGNASFGWKDPALHITVKLDEPDLGEILAVLNGYKTITGQSGEKWKGMFHKNEKGSTSFFIEKNENGTGYTVRVSKKNDGEQAIQISHQLTFGEAEVLRVIVEQIVQKIYN